MQEECKFLPRPSHPFEFPDELQMTIQLELCDLGGHKMNPSRPEMEETLSSSSLRTLLARRQYEKEKKGDSSSKGTTWTAAVYLNTNLQGDRKKIQRSLSKLTYLSLFPRPSPSFKVHLGTSNENLSSKSRSKCLDILHVLDLAIFCLYYTEKPNQLF